DLYRRTLAEIARMKRETPDAIRLDGSLRIAETDAELEDCREQLDAMRADNLAAEWYEGTEGKGLRIPTDGVFQPLPRCRTLALRADERVADLHAANPAADITGNQVTTPSGTISCDAVIVAVDGRLEQVIPELKGRVRTARLQMLATAPTDEYRTPYAVYSRDGY